MDATSFDDIVAFVSKQSRDLKIYVNGHGETTFHPDWLRLCNAIVGQGFRPIIITNLARPLNADEAACLAGFREIQVSLDTPDAVQLAKIRRRMKLSNVLQNIHMIRRAAAAARQTPPMFAISCGVYDANYAQLESLPEFCASLGISGVTFWQLTKYDDLVGVQNVYPITSLDKSAIAEAIQSVERTIGSLHQHGIPASVAGEFLDEWRKMVLAVGTP
jgi:MoaA/NifB/PqqE/SkfB family radical SAM enzyme